MNICGQDKRGSGLVLRQETSVTEQGLKAPVVQFLPFRGKEAGRNTRNLKAMVRNTFLTVAVPRTVARAGAVLSHMDHQSFTLPSKARLAALLPRSFGG